MAFKRRLKVTLFLLVFLVIAYMYPFYENTINSTTNISRKTTGTSFYQMYLYLNKYSKRYNIATNVKPKNILRSSGNFTDLSKFDRLEHIPYIVHQTNKDEMLPILYKTWMQSWLKLNPHWEYWYWSDEDLNNFINIRYPDFKQIFFGYSTGVERSDVFRYFLLYEFGGVYADLDMECLKPLDVKMREHDCVLSLDPPLHSVFMYNDQKRLVTNAFMACRPRHPYFKYVIDNLTKNNVHRSLNPVFSTGPFMIDDCLSEIEKHTKESLPFIDHSDVYQPKADQRHSRFFLAGCKKLKLHRMKYPERAKTLCNHLIKDGWYKGPRNISYAVHHWAHSWIKNFEKDEFGLNDDFRTFNITNLFNR